MGIIVNQSLKGTIFTYTGVALGFLTTGILLPRIFTTDQVGLTKIIVAYAALIAQFGTLGFNGITIRIFPYFKDKASHHHGFLSLAMISGIVGSALIILFYLLFKDLIVTQTHEKSALLNPYLDQLVILTIFQLFFILLDGYYTALLNSVHGTFLREVFQRILIIIAIGAYYIGEITFNQFVWIYMISMAIPTVYIAITLIREREFSLSSDFGFLNANLLSAMGSMALFSILNGISMLIIQTIDTIMVTNMCGLSEAGIYSICFFFGIFVSLPSRSILKITNVVSAQAWKENNLSAIRNIYEKSCITLFILGLLMFLGLWVNVENVFQILKPEYVSGKWVIFFIGLGSLIDMSTGANSSILGASPQYKIQTYFLIFLVISLVVTNLLLIPSLGMTGAALGGAISLSLLNVMRFLYLFFKYHLQPYNFKFIAVALVGGLSYWIAKSIPVQVHFILDLALRGSALVILYCVPIYLMKISPEINQKAEEIFQMIPNPWKRKI